MASDYQDESWLLRGHKLRQVQKWSANKKLSSQDHNFLNKSQKLAKQETLSLFKKMAFILCAILALTSTTLAIERYQYSQKLEQDLADSEENLSSLEIDLKNANKTIEKLSESSSQTVVDTKEDSSDIQIDNSDIQIEAAQLIITNKFQKSSDAYDKYINRIEQVKESDRKENLYRKLGRTLFANQEYYRSIEVYQMSYELAKNNNSKEGIIESLYYLGHVYDALENEEKAQEYFQKGEKELLSSYYSQYLIQGIASFSGFDEQDELTASGEKFDPTEKTAAHRDLPFGTRVRVTNPKTDLSVVVRINNRGPARTTGRIINLSESAAQEIGLTKKEGIIRVQLEAAED